MKYQLKKGGLKCKYSSESISSVPTSPSSPISQEYSATNPNLKSAKFKVDITRDEGDDAWKVIFVHQQGKNNNKQTKKIY